LKPEVEGYITSMQKYTYNLDVFYREDAISFYLLGALITDGCVQKNNGGKRVRFTSADIDWLSSIRDIICPELPIRQYNGAGVIQMDCTPLANWCIEHQCTMKKSLNVRFPNLPSKYLPDFIRGCIDGDGSITHGNYKTTNRYGSEYYYECFNCYICGSSFDFLSKMKEELQSAGLSSSLSKINKSSHNFHGRIITPKHPHYRITFGGKTCYKLLNWAYYPDHELSMTRKALKAQEAITHYQRK
jgi:hypothetical protein